jgi:hypothetical protein
MRYDAEIRIFDMLDQVMVQVRVFVTDGMSHTRPDLIVNQGVLVPGKGVDEVDEWLEDALTGLLETVIRSKTAPGKGAAWL